MHIRKLINQAIEYTIAYEEKYDITDIDLLNAIFESHLAHLINSL